MPFSGGSSNRHRSKFSGPSSGRTGSSRKNSHLGGVGSPSGGGSTAYRRRNPTLKSKNTKWGGTFSGPGSGGSNNYWRRPSLNYESDKKSVLKNAPNKQITQSYQVAENPNPFMKDVLSMGQKYNTYQRQVANPEYNEYIDKQNNKYNKKYDNFRWGNYNWNDLAQNNFESEQKLTGFYNNAGDNFMNNSATLSMAKQALFG